MNRLSWIALSLYALACALPGVRTGGDSILGWMAAVGAPLELLGACVDIAIHMRVSPGAFPPAYVLGTLANVLFLWSFVPVRWQRNMVVIWMPLTCAVATLKLLPTMERTPIFGAYVWVAAMLVRAVGLQLSPRPEEHPCRKSIVNS